MIPATLWYRETKGECEYNHLEDGHCENNVPTPKCVVHKRAWSSKWKKEFVYLTDTIPTKVVSCEAYNIIYKL